MPDPAILTLLQHLNRTPPAIIQPVPSEMGARSLTAYANYITEQEMDLQRWIVQGREIRQALWLQLKEGRSGLTLDILSEMISRFEEGLRYEAKLISRKEKRARKDEKYSEPAHKEFIANQHQRLMTIGHKFYSEGLDFACFLRAMRAELNPESRGGISFDNPDALRQHLLAGLLS